jgi:membrane associated rhomboid family serine protease
VSVTGDANDRVLQSADSARPPPVERPVPQPEQPEAPTVFARVRAAPITFAILAINIAVFVYAEYYGGGTSNPGTLLRFGALEPWHVWVGEYWRLVTCMFLHGGLVHIALNTYMSIGWSTALERVLGRKRFLLLYLLSGIGGSSMSLISGLLFHPHVSVGASGAIFGVIGATLAIRRRQFADNASFIADRGVRSIAIQFGLLTLVGLTVLPLDNAAHVGGLVVGAALGTLFTSRAPRNGWLALGAVFGVLLLLALRPWWSPRGKPDENVAAYATGYLTGRVGKEAWPVNVPLGVRLAEKGCAVGVARACLVLADHLDRTGDPASSERADELNRRVCELDPPFCLQLR